ncbi:MAG: hypothetical protein ACREAU_00480 [Nitrosopumilaceae archaeon]
MISLSVLISVLICLLIWFLCTPQESIKGAYLEFDVKLGLQTIFKGVKSMILTNEEKVELGIRGVTAGGKPAHFDGMTVWESSDPAVVMLEVGDDGLTASAIGVTVGTAQISVRGDADLDPGETEFREMVGVLDIRVVEAEAQTIELTTGTPVLQ